MGAAAAGVRPGLAPLNPAMLHYLRRLLTEMVAGSPLYIYGGLLIAAIDELRATHGALPGHPDIHYRYKDGVLTLVQDVPGDNKPLLFHGPAGADGLYRLPDGTIIGHDLGSGVFLNEIAIVLEGRKRRALTSARDSDAVNDDIKLCPDPVPDRPSAKTMSDRAKLYQHQITNLPIGMAVMLNDRMFDGCRTIDGVMLEAKGEEYAWALRNGEFFKRYRGKQEIFDQMQKQSKAAGPRLVEWHFAEEAVAIYFSKAVEALKLQGKLLNIVVIHTAPASGKGVLP
jgi:hypothetical protein